VHGETTSLEHHLVTTATMRARSLGSVAPHVPPAIVAVIDRALALEKEQRWPDARTMKLALRRAQGMRIDEPAEDLTHEPPLDKATVEVPVLAESDDEDEDADADATVPFIVRDADPRGSRNVPRPAAGAAPNAGAPRL